MFELTLTGLSEYNLGQRSWWSRATARRRSIIYIGAGITRARAKRQSRGDVTRPEVTKAQRVRGYWSRFERMTI